MKKLLTRLLLFVALVMFAFPSGAKNLYLQGMANVQDATESYGWRVSPSFDPLEVPIASDGCYYLRSFDSFKLSYCDNKPTSWDNDGGFNKTLVHFSSSGTSDNIGGNISVGKKYIKLAPRTDDKFDVTIQDSKFEIGTTTYSYAINFQNESSAWTLTSEAAMEASGSHIFTLNVKNGSEFHIKSGSTNYGPAINATKVYNGTITDVTTNGTKYLWGGGDGELKLTLTLKSDGTPASIKLEGQAVLSKDIYINGVYKDHNWNSTNDKIENGTYVVESTSGIYFSFFPNTTAGDWSGQMGPDGSVNLNGHNKAKANKGTFALEAGKYTLTNITYDGTTVEFDMTKEEVVEPDKLYYFTKTGDSWGNATEINVDGTFTVTSSGNSDKKYFVFGKNSTYSNDALYGVGSETQVQDGQSYTGQSGNSNAFYVLDGTYTITVTEFSAGSSVKFSVVKNEVVEDNKLYYFCSEGKDNWAAGGSKQVQVGSKLELTAASGGTSYFVFGTDPTLSWSSDKLYALGSSQDVSNDGEYTATYKAGTAAFEVKNGTYTITVTEFNPGVSVKFTVAKKGEEPPVPADLYVFSTNSGNWNNATGGRAVAAGETIEFSAAKLIYFVFGPKQTFDWNSNADKALLYGAQYEREVADGETRVAHHGNSQVFKIGSGKWNLTVTEFVKGETVTFTVKRLGDADIPADGYVEYVLYDETDNTAFELEWDINAGNYRGKVTDGVQAALGANKKGHLFTVRAKKNGATEFDKFGKPDNNHWYIQSGANSVDLTKDAKSLYLNCDKEHYIKVDVKDGRYTAPSNVAFIEVGNPENAGKVYLVAPFLNDNYESPAWELKPQSDGSYFLGEFAMRKNEHKNDNGNQYYIDIAVYDEFGTRTIKTVKREGFRVPREYTRQPGRKCTATLDKDMTVLTITAVPDETLASVLPYVGIVGKNFRQSVNMKTRHDYTKNGEERMGHTDDGWQEAYVEYGQFGSPLLDANGEAYYNTVWPPRNNILMQSYLGEGIEPLNVSSRDLTMTPDARGIMTGAQWVAALQAENADEYKESYDGLSDTGADKNGFKLDANCKYARYVVKNVWMMGEYKIWTGFAGKLASFGADWNRFRYWGPGGRDDNAADNRRKEMHKTYILYGEQNNFFTEDLGENNNVKDYAREYYRSMEFFIPVNDQETDFEYLGGNDEIRPRFYLTKAVGGAKIDAIATGTVGNQKVGYAPTFENMSGYHVGGYTVTRYAYDANTDVENLLSCDQNRTATTKEAAKVVGATGVNYTDVTAFLDALKEGKTTFTTSGGKTEWIPDGQEKTYAPGRYIFRFEVTYVNDLDATDTKKADVWSPYVEIFEEQGAVHIFHAQLVELPEEHELAKQGYKYVSYSKDRSRFHRVAVKADASDKPTELTRQESDAMIASLREVYLKTGVWTNKNLLLTEEPENFRGDKTDFKFLKKEGEVDAAGEYTQVANLLDDDAPKIRNWYAWIDNNKAQIETPETYKVDFKGNLTTVNGTQTTVTEVAKDNETVHYPQFPLPYIDTPEARVYSKIVETPTTEWPRPEKYTASHEHLNFIDKNVADDNPFQQWREDEAMHRLEVKVPVQLPNISTADGLRDAAYGKLTVKVNDKELGVDKENLAAGRAYIVYDHQSPYDWLTYDNGWKAKDATSWNTTGSKFATTDCAIEGISEPGIHDKTAVLATFAPSFDTPSLSLEDGTLGFRGEWSGPENGIYTYTGYLTVFNPTSHPIDALVGNNDLVPEENGSYTPQYLCHVESTGDVDGVSDVETVSQMISGSNMKYKLVSAKVRADKLENMSDFMRTLKLSFSRAYYFFSGNKDGVTEATTHRNCGSTLVGLTGEFPFHIGGDIHTVAPSAAPVQNAEGQPNGEAAVNLEPSTTGLSSTLYAGDNAFLFAPKYKTFDFSLLSDIQVGIDGIMPDGAADVEPVYYNLQGVRIENPGKGLYIKVTGAKSEKVML